MLVVSLTHAITPTHTHSFKHSHITIKINYRMLSHPLDVIQNFLSYFLMSAPSNRCIKIFFTSDKFFKCFFKCQVRTIMAYFYSVNVAYQEHFCLRYIRQLGIWFYSLLWNTLTGKLASKLGN